MKTKLFGILMFAGLLLVGCEESSTTEDGKLSDEYVESAFDELHSKNHSTELPKDVLNGTVSEDVYLETTRYATDFIEYEQSMLDFVDKMNKNPSLKQDKVFADQFKESLNSYEVFIKGFNLSPTTDADYEIDRHLSDTLLYTSYVISSLRQYVSTGESHHISSLGENYDKRDTSYQALTNTIKKFELD